MFQVCLDVILCNPLLGLLKVDTLDSILFRTSFVLVSVATAATAQRLVRRFFFLLRFELKSFLRQDTQKRDRYTLTMVSHFPAVGRTLGVDAKPLASLNLYHE